MASVADNVLLFESPLTKVPYEQLRKGFKTGQRNFERDFVNLSSTVADIKDASTQGDAEDARESSIASIDAMIARVEALKRKFGSVQNDEMLPMQHAMRARVDSLVGLENIASTSSLEYAQWSETRMDRWLVDSMLRSGRFNSGKALAQAKGIEPLVDIEIFAEIERVKTALENHSCTEALSWCADNKPALRKAKNTLEFDLRLQEFVELVRDDKFLPAIAYSRKYLVQWHDAHPVQFRQAMGLLAFRAAPPPTSIPSSYSSTTIYTAPSKNPALKKLYDPAAWTHLARKYTETAYGLTSLSSTPLLSLSLYAGLSALKHPDCVPRRQKRIQNAFNEDSDSSSDEGGREKDSTRKNPDCPVCDASGLGVLARDVPSCQHLNSRLVCALSGKIMDDNNPPLAFTSGYVYSRQALEEMAAHNNGIVTCPISNVTMKFSDLRRVYVT